MLDLFDSEKVFSFVSSTPEDTADDHAYATDYHWQITNLIKQAFDFKTYCYVCTTVGMTCPNTYIKFETSLEIDTNQFFVFNAWFYVDDLEIEEYRTRVKRMIITPKRLKMSYSIGTDKIPAIVTKLGKHEFLSLEDEGGIKLSAIIQELKALIGTAPRFMQTILDLSSQVDIYKNI